MNEGSGPRKYVKESQYELNSNDNGKLIEVFVDSVISVTFIDGLGFFLY